MWYWTCDECNNENPCINDTCELCGKKWSASTAAEIQKKKKEAFCASFLFSLYLFLEHFLNFLTETFFLLFGFFGSLGCAVL